MICPTPLLLDDDLIVEVKAEACRRGAPVADTLCDLLAARVAGCTPRSSCRHVAEDRSSRNGHGSESQPVKPLHKRRRPGDCSPGALRTKFPDHRPTPTIDASGRSCGVDGSHRARRRWFVRLSPTRFLGLCAEANGAATPRSDRQAIS